MPVLVIEAAEDALPLADALASGGINVLEITLRTAASLDAIEAIRAARPQIVVGAGTVLSPTQCQAAFDAGAQFAVSPGFSARTVALARELGLPFLPGAITPTEVQQCMEAGLDTLKFFPAEVSGGIAMLKSLGSVYPEVQFCPTGGISAGNLQSYLALANVSCVGGSWLAPRQLISGGRWDDITNLAMAATE